MCFIVRDRKLCFSSRRTAGMTAKCRSSSSVNISKSTRMEIFYRPSRISSTLISFILKIRCQCKVLQYKKHEYLRQKATGGRDYNRSQSCLNLVSGYTAHSGDHKKRMRMSMITLQVNCKTNLGILWSVPCHWSSRTGLLPDRWSVLELFGFFLIALLSLLRSPRLRRLPFQLDRSSLRFLLLV